MLFSSKIFQIMSLYCFLLHGDNHLQRLHKNFSNSSIFSSDNLDGKLSTAFSVFTEPYHSAKAYLYKVLQTSEFWNIFADTGDRIHNVPQRDPWIVISKADSILQPCPFSTKRLWMSFLVTHLSISFCRCVGMVNKALAVKQTERNQLRH